MKEYKKLLDELKERKIDISKLYIYDCLICSFEWCNPLNKFYDLKEEHQRKLVNFVYNTWLKADNDVSISLICDKIAESASDILNGILTHNDILDVCYMVQ